MKTNSLLLCAALLLAPATSFGSSFTTSFSPPAPGAGSPVNDEGAKLTQTGTVRELIFDTGDTVEGETLAPGGANIQGKVNERHRSMISIRGEFLSQLITLSRDI
jgi:hypothetical protein